MAEKELREAIEDILQNVAAMQYETPTEATDAIMALLPQQLAQAQAEVAAMREALVDLSCAIHRHPQEHDYYERIYALDDRVTTALSGTAGQAMLARLAKLEAFTVVVRGLYENASKKHIYTWQVYEALAALGEEGSDG